MGNRNSTPWHRGTNPQGSNNGKPKAVRSDAPRRFFKRANPPTTISIEPKTVPQNNTQIPRTASNISTNRVSSQPWYASQIVERFNSNRGGYHSKSKAVLSEAPTHIVNSTSDPTTVSNPPTTDPRATIGLIAKPKVTLPQHNTQIPHRALSNISSSQQLAILTRTPETEEESEQV
jgi:hypothetical protein